MNAVAARAPVGVVAARWQADGGGHCAEAEYAAILSTLNIHGAYRRQRLAARRRFVAAYPDLSDWFREPLERRVGRLAGEQRGAISHRTSYDARSYLLFLGLAGHARFDYAWMLASGHLYACELAAHGEHPNGRAGQSQRGGAVSGTARLPLFGGREACGRTPPSFCRSSDPSLSPGPDRTPPSGARRARRPTALHGIQHPVRKRPERLAATRTRASCLRARRSADLVDSASRSGRQERPASGWLARQ